MTHTPTTSMRFARWYVPRGRLGLARFWTDSVVSWFGGSASALVAAVTLVPTVAAAVCRLHDGGHSADWLWWLALPGLGWVILIDAVWFSAGRPAGNAYGPSPDRAPERVDTPREWVA
jgi:uncharacterized membrane protein YhaH (DUF805 family)